MFDARFRKTHVKGALLFAKIFLNILFCSTVPSLLMHSASNGDPWWSSGATRGGDGEGRSLCRSCILCFTLQKKPGGRECHQNPSQQLGSTGNTFPFFCGCLAKLRSIVQNMPMWEQRRRRICVFGVSQALIQPRLEGYHKLWSFSQIGMHMDWECDLSAGHRVSVLWFEDSWSGDK